VIARSLYLFCLYLRAITSLPCSRSTVANQAPCRHTSRRFRNCKCPIWVQGSLQGEGVRQSLDLRSWEAASDLVRGWEASGQIAVIKPEVPTVKEAVAKLLDGLEHGQQRSKATLSKHKNLLEKRLLPWCENVGSPAQAARRHDRP